MTGSGLTAALDVLVDRCDDDHGDWADVLGRAGLALEPALADGRLAVMPRSRRRTSTRRIGLVALAAVLLGVVALVATGFARDALSLLDRIDVEFRSSEPAPEVARWRFEDLAVAPLPGMPEAIASQTRTAGTITVKGQERALWVAPARRGGFWRTRCRRSARAGPGNCGASSGATGRGRSSRARYSSSRPGGSRNGRRPHEIHRSRGIAHAPHLYRARQFNAARRTAS